MLDAEGTELKGDQVRFEPLENAADFMLTAARHLRGSPSARDLKYATLHVVAGVEILLKWRLSQEHYSLVFTNLKRFGGRSELDQWDGSDFRSVDAREAFRRLRDVVGLDVPDEVPGLEALAGIRNQFAHHGVEVSTPLIQTNAARLLNYVLTFIDEHCRDDEQRLPIALAETLEDIRPILSDIRGLIEKRLVSLESRLSAADRVLTCPDCHEKALIVDEGVECLLCLVEYGSDQAAEQWVESVLGFSRYRLGKEGQEWPVFWCPDCLSESLVQLPLGHEDFSPDTGWFCFGGGETYTASEIARCERCNEPAFAYMNGFAMCGICSDDLRAEQ